MWTGFDWSWDQKWAFVNTAMNLRLSLKPWEITDQLKGSQSVKDSAPRRLLKIKPMQAFRTLFS